MSNDRLVEDSVSFRRALVDILRTHFPLVGFDRACDPDEGLRKIEQLRPGLVFMDIQSPKENRSNVTRKINLVYEDVVIAILTSCSLSDYRQQYVRKEPDSFHVKEYGSGMQDAREQVETPLASKPYH